MAQTARAGETDREPIVDDYQIDRSIGQATRPASRRILAVINALLLIILAAVSFALFCVVAALLGFP